MSKSYPINCNTMHKKLAKIGFDDSGKAVVWLWCKACRVEHICTLPTMLRSWRDMVVSDKKVLVAFRDMLSDAVQSIDVGLKADLEDGSIVEPQEEVM